MNLEKALKIIEGAQAKYGDKLDQINHKYRYLLEAAICLKNEIMGRYIHTHKAKYDKNGNLLRECKDCGLDISDDIHIRGPK